MNILLVYPKFPDTFWSFKHALKFIRKKASDPPLGLLTVAAMLPAEWEKRLVDLNVRDLTQKDLAWADYVFIGAMVVQRLCLGANGVCVEEGPGLHRVLPLFDPIKTGLDQFYGGDLTAAYFLDSRGG